MAGRDQAAPTLGAAAIASPDEIRPFQIEIRPDAVADLRERLRKTRWPDPETVDDWSQGTPLAYLRELCRYWERDYDWRAAEARLNRFPQFVTSLDGLDIHFIHVRSPHNDAMPLVMTHGWPGSVTEFKKVIGPLADPACDGGDPADAFHVVCPSLPGFGHSGKPRKTGWGAGRTAEAWDALMNRLGYPCYGAQGGDWGTRVTMAMARRQPDSLIGIHLNMVPFPQPAGDIELALEERAALHALAEHRSRGSGYSAVQSTRPQSVGYGLTDSPAALAGWIVEKFHAWSDCGGDLSNAFTNDELLDNIMLYWLPAAGASAARLYWESFMDSDERPIAVPAACSVFPADIYRPSRRMAEPWFSDLRYWNELPAGGHFAALEKPATFVGEVRRAFRELRPGRWPRTSTVRSRVSKTV